MPINITQLDSTAIIELDDPRRRNALDPDGARELACAIHREARRDGQRGLVLTGKGAFCAGGDLPSVLALVQNPDQDLRSAIGGVYQGLTRAILDSPVPVVAAIDGPAIGLGLDLAAVCDLRFIGESGWLMQGWAAVGLIPAAGGLKFLLENVSSSTLWEWIVSQPRITPEVADELGIATYRRNVTGIEASLQFLKSLETLPQQTVSGYLELFRHATRSGIDEYLGDCLNLQIELLQSPEFAKRSEARLRPRDNSTDISVHARESGE